MAGGSRGKRGKKGKLPRATSGDNDAAANEPQPQSAGDESQLQQQQQAGEADNSEINQPQQQEGAEHPSAAGESGGNEAAVMPPAQTTEGAETQLVEAEQEAEIAPDDADAAAALGNQSPNAGAAAFKLDSTAEQQQQRLQESGGEMRAGGADESGAEAAGAATAAAAARSPHTKPAGEDEKQQDAAAPASIGAPLSLWGTSAGEGMKFGRKKSSGFNIGGAAGEAKTDEARAAASHSASEQSKLLEIEDVPQGLQGEALDSYGSRGVTETAGEMGGEGLALGMGMEGAMHAQPPGQHGYAAPAEGLLGSSSAADRFGRPNDNRAPFVSSRGQSARPPQRMAGPASHAQQQLPARPAFAPAPMQGMLMAPQAAPMTDMLSTPIQDLLTMTPLLSEFVDPNTGEMDANLQQAILNYDPSVNYFSFDWNRQFTSVQEAREIQQGMVQELDHTFQEIQQVLGTELDHHRDLVLQSSSAAVEEFKRRLDERAEQLLVEESSELQMEAQLDEAQEEMQALSVPTSVVGGRRRAEVTEVDDITMQ